MLETLWNVITFIPWLLWSIVTGIIGFIITVFLFPFKAIIAVFSSIILFFSPGTVAASPAPTAMTNPPAQVQMQVPTVALKPQPLNYRKASFEQLDKGTELFFNGRVFQVVSNKSAIIATRPAIYGDDYSNYSEDFVFLVSSEPLNVLENDVVRVQGSYSGIQEYKTVLGAEKRVPLIKVDSYKPI